MQTADALNGVELTDTSDVAALRELVEKTIHKKYVLSAALRRGVAFHYGNMPLLVRNEIERLFRSGVLKYLVCTSTLLEGVNLPCRNLFARGPKKGNRQYMSPADFWNLAGRAGRWGKEFQGNIVCVDTSIERQWPSPPRERVKQPLTRATDTVMSDVDGLRSYVREGTPVEMGREVPLLESVFSFLATRVAEGLQITSVPGISLDDADAMNLQDDIGDALGLVELPVELWRKHAGVSPLSMQRLLQYFRDKDDQDSLQLAPPESADAAESYVRALSRISRFLGGNFGVAGRQWVLSILIVNWMRGSPLARLISERVTYYESRGDPKNLSSIIRSTMQDVEQVARFEAPKYLACYVDVLKYHLETIGQEEAAEELPDISMMLELGVSRETELSLMTLGLSRTSAVALSELIVTDDLSVSESVRWLRENDPEQLDLPVLVRREIASVLERFPLESGA